MPYSRPHWATVLLVIKLRGCQAISVPTLRSLAASQPSRDKPSEQLINLGALCQQSEVRDRDSLCNAFRGLQHPHSRSDDYAFLRESRQNPDRVWTLCFWDGIGHYAEMAQLRTAILGFFARGCGNLDGIRSALASHVRARSGDSALSSPCVATVAESPDSGTSISPVSPVTNERASHWMAPSSQPPIWSRLPMTASGFYLPSMRECEIGTEASVVASPPTVTRRLSPQAATFRPSVASEFNVRSEADEHHSPPRSTTSSELRGGAPVFQPLFSSVRPWSKLSPEVEEFRPSPCLSPADLQVAAAISQRPSPSAPTSGGQAGTATTGQPSPPAPTESSVGAEVEEDHELSHPLFAMVQAILSTSVQGPEHYSSPVYVADPDRDPDNNLWPLPALPKVQRVVRRMPDDFERFASRYDALHKDPWWRPRKPPSKNTYPLGPWARHCEIVGCGHGRYWPGCAW